MHDSLPPDDRSRPTVFDATARRRLLDAYRAAEAAGDPREAASIGEAYRALVPRLPLSRSPIDGTVVEHSIDAIDIDGLWWDYQNPRRPIEQLPDTWFAMAGAMRLHAPVPETSFLVVPGPEVPFVVPRILEREGMEAVVSAVPVGPHAGYAITYFAPAPVPLDLKRINTWGRSDYAVLHPDRGRGWDAAEDWTPEWDYDLAPWIKRGKLSWIAPGDGALVLHRDVAGCPYVGLDGNHEVARVQFGRVTYPPPPPEAVRHFRPNG